MISAEAVRRLTGNANLQRVILDGSLPLDIGRASRFASLAQWKALVARDGGCRGPDCTIPAEWCEVDHIHEWTAQTGSTDIDVLALFCVYHHHYRHRPGVELIGDGNNLAIRHPDGRVTPLPARGPTHASHPRQPAPDIRSNTPTAPPSGAPGDAPTTTDSSDAGARISVGLEHDEPPNLFHLDLDNPDAA